MAIVLVADVLRSRRASGSALAWMLAIVLAPYLGVPLYLVLGGRKMKRSADSKLPLYVRPAGPVEAHSDVERVLLGVGSPPARPGNRVELLETGEAAFAALVALIDSASETLDLSTLILADDDVGTVIVER